MDLKERVEEFKKTEDKLKNDLLKKIQEEFATYGKEKVIFIDPRDDNYFDESKEAQAEMDKLQDLRIEINPLIGDENCYIDGTAAPAYIALTKQGLTLHVYGESWDPEYFYITLQEPNWGLSVKDLYGLLKLLQSDVVKKLNQ